MAEKNPHYEIEVLRVEKGSDSNYEFVFECELGKYNLELGEGYYCWFMPGKKYTGILGSSAGMPDFKGKKEQVTFSYNLEKILDEGVLRWEKK